MEQEETVVLQSKSKSNMGHTSWNSLPQALSVMGPSIGTSSHQLTQDSMRKTNGLDMIMESTLRMKYLQFAERMTQSLLGIQKPAKNTENDGVKMSNPSPPGNL